MLDDFIETNQISAQILTFDEEVATCAQAKMVEKATPVVKTIVLAHSKGFALAVVEMSKKVDISAVARILETSAVRLSTPEEVESVTGYAVGGVPPISVYGNPTLIDEGVLSHAWVVAGGGDAKSLLKIMTKDILAHAFEARVEKISK
ncbi:MAG: YbaK/EbsC family protein [archaeon]